MTLNETIEKMIEREKKEMDTFKNSIPGLRLMYDIVARTITDDEAKEKYMEYLMLLSCNIAYKIVCISKLCDETVNKLK